MITAEGVNLYLAEAAHRNPTAEEEMARLGIALDVALYAVVHHHVERIKASAEAETTDKDTTLWFAGFIAGIGMEQAMSVPPGGQVIGVHFG